MLIIRSKHPLKPTLLKTVSNQQTLSLLPVYRGRPPFRCHSSSVALPSLVKEHVQSYISRSDDAFLNLAIENYLLQNSPPDSVILLFYVNKPSIVIGRNQNPWLEVNLPLLRDDSTTVGKVDLVRRRSGGGTVFHDEGNVNWSVIVHPSVFTRDKHCDMVVRALHSQGIHQAQVNDRHDVVITDNDSTRKVSGSAYKLTKHRALHHGTCLLSSPNLKEIGRYLRSQLRGQITAKGVESVSSPIANVGISNDDFVRAVRVEFEKLYQPEGVKHHVIDEECFNIQSIAHDISEMEVSSLGATAASTNSS